MSNFDKDPIKSLEIEIRLLKENIRYYTVHSYDPELVNHYTDLKLLRQKELEELLER